MARRKIKINLPGLLRMLGENIYAEPDVAVREMIQNAHDTSIIRTTLDESFSNPSIEVTFNHEQGTLTFADNGAGMTEDELHKNLSTVGESFTRIQRDELHGANAEKSALLIGQFGIGLLSAFSISERVEVYTRSYQHDQTGCFWSCEGDIHYTTELYDKPEVGTRIVLYLLDSKMELLDEKRLRQAIKKYADFLSVPILLQGKQVNSTTPPWEEDEGQTDLHEYIQSRWGLFPLGLIPFNSASAQSEDGQPLPNVSGLLFIPLIPFELTRDFGEVDVYITRMFIKANDKELLPHWARFVKGVINTSELTPTLSRGEVIIDEAYRRVQDLLGGIIIAYLRMLQQKDVEKLKLLVGAYNNTIKARALEDDAFFDAICDLVRVNTDLGHITIQEYLEKSDNVIYYFAESGSGTQHKLLFSHKGLPVIDASWGMEEYFLEAYAKRKGLKVERLAADSGVIFREPDTVSGKWETLELAFKQRIGKEARAVEFEPETVPAVLVARPLQQEDKELANINAVGAQTGVSSDAIKQMFQKMAKSKSLRVSESDTFLHLNIKNPLINQLRDMPRSETFDLALNCIYNNSLMFAHHYVSADNAEVIFEANNRAFSAMIANAQALTKQQEALAKVERERDELTRRIPHWSLPSQRTIVELSLRTKFQSFDEDIENQIVKRIQSLVTLAPPIVTLGSYSGSTKFAIELTVEQASQLLFLFQSGKLEDLGISDIRVLADAAVTGIVEEKTQRSAYDVFLCHNTNDKTEVRRIGIYLRSRGILPWLDDWELRPGIPWQDELQKHIEKIPSAAVFVGDSEVGPWQNIELNAFIKEFIDRKCPVIPVLLRSCRREPKLPVFLNTMKQVDFRKRRPDPISMLIWGITGKKQ
ncbi:Chaperone protein HtpG [Gimesia panareensis]|uniref:Chaperone protein HtpG n=1 Tax=Gimesia panareensis TaxID=2527978 RepID=A0A517Q0I0_9PLAN|nr:TIR domain-containing protein [Gimesia panareensis]QDT25137.1 Chaperone protein HtpG [Gimesia panareensis]